MKSFFLILTILFFVKMNAQTSTFYYHYDEYQNSFGNSTNDMKKTLDNHLITISTQYNVEGMSLVKMDTIGNILWQTNFDTPYPNQFVCGLVQTNDSSYIVLFTCSGGVLNGSPAIIKFDKNGSYLWAQKFNVYTSNYATCITETENGGFAIAGSGCSGNNFVVKFDSAGTILWEKSFPILGSISASGWDIVHNSDNSLVVSGVRGNDMYTDFEPFLLSLDPLGNVNWIYSYPFPVTTWSKGFTKSIDGGYTITGYASLNGIYTYSTFVLHTDGNGNLLWSRSLGYPTQNFPNDVLQLSDGNYILSGSVNYSSMVANQFLNIKMDPMGTIIWAQSSGGVPLNGNGSDEIYTIETVNGKNFFASGASGNTFLFKFDSDGVGNCSADTVQFMDVDMHFTQNTPQYYDSPFYFQSDTIQITINPSNLSKSVYCSTTNVTELSEDVTITISPNPFSSEVKIESDFFFFDANLTLYDCYGNTVRQLTNIDGNSIHLKRENLSSGFYFLELSEAGKKYTFQKIVIVD